MSEKGVITLTHTEMWPKAPGLLYRDVQSETDRQGGWPIGSYLYAFGKTYLSWFARLEQSTKETMIP